MVGIYCIENMINHKKYIGQSQDIEERWRCHRGKLKRGEHYNFHLQMAWNKYGEDNFAFYVVELCDVESLNTRESHYIKKFNSFKCGYNMTEGGEGTRGYHHSEEYKQYWSNQRKGIPKTDEAKRNMSLAKKGKPLKNHDTEKVREGYKIVSQKLKGRKHTEEHKRKNSESHKGRIPWNKGMHFEKEEHPLFGKHHSDETKRKISQANKGKKRTYDQKLACAKKVRCVETGEVFNSITEAANAYSVSVHSISKVLNGHHKTSKKMHWVFLEGGGESNDIILI